MYHWYVCRTGVHWVPSHATARHCPWHKASPSDIQCYAHSVEEALSSIVVSDNLLTCCDSSCLSHQLEVDLIGSAIVKCLHDCASNTMPKPCSIAGWSESVKPQKIKADLWYKIRHDAGCPASGVLFEIKKRTKVATSMLQDGHWDSRINCTQIEWLML